MVVAATLLTVSPMAQAQPPQIVQIVREPVRVGREAAYKTVEDDTARACAELKCPHPHLALEPLTGPREVWWFNFFASEAERQRVTDAYARNRPLMTVLERNSRRKASFTREPVNLILTYQPDLSRNARWELAGARFLAVTVTKKPPRSGGTVFEAPDGTCFVLRPARTRAEAERVADESGPQTTVLAVRPYWGMPAREWLDADRDFWTSNPVARTRTP